MEVAKALGTSQAFVSKCERGERRIDAVELSDFAQLYGTPLHSLLPPSSAPRLARPTYPQSRQVAERTVGPGGGKARRHDIPPGSTERQPRS